MGVATISRKWFPAAAWDALRADAERFGSGLTGFHNVNYLLEKAAQHAEMLGVDFGTPVKIRLRRKGLKVVERSWADEGVILRALDRTAAVSNTPRYYAGCDDISVHEYVAGRTLSDVCPPGKPLDPIYLDSIIRQLALFTQVSAADLPPLPDGWAANGDSAAFLRDRVDFVEREVRRANWAEFSALFAALEVPANALRVFRVRIPALRSRPFALLHGDLHRHNVIVREDHELTIVDWELAMWGDPLHDLAIHLVRMRYPSDQRWEVIERWRTAVGPEFSAGLAQDLPVYINYERAQSLFADTLRAAHRFAGDHPKPGALDAAVSRVRNALHLAAVPLRLSRVPTRTEVERALLGWLRDRAA